MMYCDNCQSCRRGMKARIHFDLLNEVQMVEVLSFVGEPEGVSVTL